MRKIIFLSILSFILNGCASPAYKEAVSAFPNKEWISVYGKYGQTFMNRQFIMEVAYDDSSACALDINYSINNDESIRSAMEAGNLAFICAAYPNSINVPYEGQIRLATSNKTYVAKFASKNVCNIMKSEAKSKSLIYDIVCP